MKLEGKVAIVTGGAMGNGLGIVKVFLKYGATVVIFDTAKELASTLGELKGLFPNGNFTAYQVDIRDQKMVSACVKAVYDKFGKIDILVNNAGVCRLSPFLQTTDEIRDFHFDVNIKGTWNVTKAVVPYMQKNQSASIINLSSVTGTKVADPGEVAYATTKAALVGFTKGLAADLVKDHIRVNAILPGYLYTPMVENMARTSNPSHPEQVIDGIKKAIPMQRMGKVEELGELAAFLACEESSYITAETIVFDGGSTLPETMTMGT